MRSKNMLIAAAALLSASAFTLGMTLKRDLSTIAENGGESVAYVNGEVAASGDGLTANNRGYCYVYDIPTNTLLGEFWLASGTADGTVATAYLNHANQMMFGAEKFDENDDFPLLYVTTGNSGDHDTDGSYISKCAIERISFDGSTNTWSSELVQTIQFNDAENIPDTDKDGDLLQTFNATDKKFYYVSGNGYDSEKGYQKIGWGWAAAFVDTDPTEVTKDKFYLFCPRVRAYYTPNLFGAICTVRARTIYPLSSTTALRSPRLRARIP